MHCTPRVTHLLVVIALLVASGAHAEHEADHRYSIRGYLVDAQGQPVAGAVVSARLAGQRTAGRTDAEGYYVLDMHLHDEDIGREIALRAGTATGTIRMRAKAGDSHAERIHWASFVDGQLREDDLGRFRLPGWAWVVIGLTGIVLLFVAGAKLQKASLRRRRAAERAVAAQRQPRKTKRGKGSKRRK